MDLNLRRKLVRVIFGRADAWVHQTQYQDKPLKRVRCYHWLYF